MKSDDMGIELHPLVEKVSNFEAFFFFKTFVISCFIAFYR